MSIQPQPIYGNQYFKEVQNVASTNFQRIHADQLVTSHLQIGVDTKLAGDLKKVTVKGYAPTALIGTTITDGVSLCSTPAATTTLGNALALPAGAIITDLVLRGGSLTGGPVAIETSTALNATGPVIYATNPSTSNINLGASPSLLTQTGLAATPTYITVQPQTSAVTAGSLAAYITYVKPESA
jgi:hypothetical protein